MGYVKKKKKTKPNGSVVGFSLQHFSVILEPACPLSLVALKEGLGTHGGSQLLINSMPNSDFFRQLVCAVGGGERQDNNYENRVEDAIKRTHLRETVKIGHVFI